MLAVVGARLYLAVDHPFDVVAGVALGVAIPLAAFRFFTPNDVVPVTYGAGKKAHLDVGGRRGRALREAVEDQLGVTVVEVVPVGLAGSGGSTPLRMRLAGDPDTFVFGKLYAMNHVRSDRWYKIGRTIMYGRLEDETPFQSVHRLVQYEDYALRVMRDAGVPTAAHSGSSSSPRVANTSSSPSSSTARWRSARPRSTTESSTRASRSCAGCGRPDWPTGTSSRRTCSSRTAISS